MYPKAKTEDLEVITSEDFTEVFCILISRDKLIKSIEEDVEYIFDMAN
jgi:hypothetical protein